MIKFNEYDVQTVHSAMDSVQRAKYAFLPDGKRFKRTSQRLVLFRSNTSCVDCGIEGTRYILEASAEGITPHLNLYAVDGNGKLILMTKDHILPRSKGGRDVMENYQTMCQPCNAHKGNTLEEERKLVSAA